MDLTLIVLPTSSQGSRRTAAAKGPGCGFAVPGLRPGDYEVAAVRNLEAGGVFAPSIRSGVGNLAKVTVEPGGRLTLKRTPETVVNEY